MREAVVNLGADELEALGLGELVAAFRDADVTDLEEFACYGDGAVVQAETGEPVDAATLDGLDEVDRWERLTDGDPPHRYLVAFTAPGLGDDIAAHAEDLLGTCEPDLDGDDLTLSLVGPQRAIRGTVEAYRDAGVVPALERHADYAGEDRALRALTDRQREVLETAYDMGYFEVPREVDTAEVAEALDVDPSTVAEHLQRAERNLLARHLDPA